MNSNIESGSRGAPTVAGQKRKSSTSEATSPIKHRASQACQSCRGRKVRCDVIRSDSECTNCRLDGLECVVLPSRRGQSSRTARNSVGDATRPRVTRPTRVADSSGTQDLGHDNAHEQDEGGSTSSLPDNPGQVPVCVTFDQDIDSAASEQGTTNGIARTAGDIDIADAYNGLLTPDTGANTVRQNHVERAVLPTFISPLSDHLLDEDIDFLVRKGATTVPEPDLQLEILRGYLFSVHPFMPMLDFRPFIDAILNNPGHRQISLLLFQAVMYSGLHSLPLPVIHRLGFETTKQARKVLFDRVKLLYDFDVESDDAAVLQSLILMSSWYNTWHDRRQTWHWTGLAYDIARHLGLHREPSIRHASSNVRHFRRRLWWSLYIRDRLIALGARRPLRIRDDEFNVAMLTLEDFDLGHEEYHRSPPLVPSVEERTSTALMCIQLAKLCVCIGHVTSSQYTTLSRNPNVPHTMMIVSSPKEDRDAELERCDTELHEWFQALEKNAGRQGSDALVDPQSCSEVHWAMLKIAYLTTVNVLHRGLALQSKSKASDDHNAQKSSRAKVKDAARRITKDSQVMLLQDQVRYFGLLGVTALIAASLSHLLDISSGDEDVRDASTFRFYQSVEVLQYLRSIYASADAAVSFLASATRTAGISIPSQIDAPTVDYGFTTVKCRPFQVSHAAGFQGRGLSYSERRPNIIKAFQRSNSPQDHQHVHLTEGQHIQVLDNSDVLGRHTVTGIGATSESVPKRHYTPSASTLQTFNMSKPVTFAGGPDFIEAVPGGITYSPVDEPVAGWNQGIDASMGLFNYDFYSNAFDFFDGPFQDA